jgi:hypothetical protein
MTSAEIVACAKKQRGKEFRYKLLAYAAFLAIVATSLAPDTTVGGRVYRLGGLVYREVPTHKENE